MTTLKIYNSFGIGLTLLKRSIFGNDLQIVLELWSDTAFSIWGADGVILTCVTHSCRGQIFSRATLRLNAFQKVARNSSVHWAIYALAADIDIFVAFTLSDRQAILLELVNNMSYWAS
jgi:hypothetical protein